MEINGTLIFDFDSTITSVEALDVLAVNCLKGLPDQQERIRAIHEITEAAMLGRMGFDEALQRRLDLLPLQRHHLFALINFLSEKISTSFLKHLDFFQKNQGRIYVVSGGFKEFIIPVVAHLHIPENLVFANTFLWSEDDRVIGFDALNPLSQKQGKIRLLHALQLPTPLVVIGDGFTDAEIKNAGVADRFYLYAEHTHRVHLEAMADAVIYSLDDFIEYYL